MKKWGFRRRFKDEPNKAAFVRGTIAFAGLSHVANHSQICHLFICLSNTTLLGQANHEAALGKVTDDTLGTLSVVEENYKKSNYTETRHLQCMGRVFGRNLAFEDAIGSHACSFEARMRVTNGIPLGCSLLLPVHTVNCGHR
jgi:hypothetical protein